VFLAQNQQFSIPDPDPIPDLDPDPE